MSELTTTIHGELDRLFDAAMALRDSGLLRTPYDPEWRSKSEVSHDGEFAYWRPVPQVPPVSFDGLGAAIESPIHPDIQAFYGSFWAGSLETESVEGQVTLIQLWNEEDFERLVGNLVGHYMAKKQSRSPFTVFFATTEPDSEYFLTIRNEDGVILLEEPGRVVREVESSMATFLARLTPVNADPAIF